MRPVVRSFIQVIHKLSLYGVGFSTNHSLITLMQGALFELSGEDRRRLSGLTKHQQSLHGLVQPMNHSQIRTVQIIFQLAHHIRLPDSGGLGGKPRRLVSHDDMLVLIFNTCPHPFVPILLP